MNKKCIFVVLCETDKGTNCVHAYTSLRVANDAVENLMQQPRPNCEYTVRAVTLTEVTE